MMKNYEQMSDFEVNRAVAERLYGYKGPVGERMPNGVKATDDTGMFYTESDYCNNPSDAWPVIDDNNIGILQDGAFDTGKGLLQASVCVNKNRLRAAMIVFLMMGDE